MFGSTPLAATAGLHATPTVWVRSDSWTKKLKVPVWDYRVVLFPMLVNGHWTLMVVRLQKLPNSYKGIFDYFDSKYKDNPQEKMARTTLTRYFDVRNSLTHSSLTRHSPVTHPSLT